MNGLFQVATRTLGLGVLAALSLVAVVVFKGIHPEVLVAFRELRDDTLLAADGPTHTSPSDDPAPLPPEHFAQAQSDSRLDVPTGIRSALNGQNRPSLLAKRSSPDELSQANDLMTGADPSRSSLPPLPDAQDATESFTEEPVSGPALELPPSPNHEAELDHREIAQVPPTVPTQSPAEAPVETAKRNSSKPGTSPPKNSSAVPAPLAITPRATHPAATSAATPQVDSKLAAQLNAMQEQLNRISAQQEQHQESQQSWLESHQLLHQRQLQQKLEGIEAGLRELQAQARTSPRSSTRSTVIRHDKPGTEQSPLTAGVTSAVRDAIESLADQSNVNLTLSINVEGDIEMNVQNGAEENGATNGGGTPVNRAPVALPPNDNSGMAQNPRGYVVQKKGHQKVFIPPVVIPQQHQREVFLPPIIKDPQKVRR